jgi:flagellar P-ring protein precursor FlgI
MLVLRRIGTIGLLVVLWHGAAGPARGELRVQDIARLQGQRTNKLMGYGLVVGLNGTGDGEQYAPTMRMLMRLHERYHAPILTGGDIKGNNSVAIVAVEAEIPEFGAREGQTVDVSVSVIGSAKSLVGGRLLTTPLQYVMFDERDPATQGILALAGGSVFVPDERTPTRAVVRGGAVLEEDIVYTFIVDGGITLVLEDTKAGWTWAHMVARALNHELSNPIEEQLEEQAGSRRVVRSDHARALGPKSIRVWIPPYELPNPSNYISRVLRTRLFMVPEQVARVTINRTTKDIAFTENVTVSPTVLQIPGLGSVMIGKTVPAEGNLPERVRPVSFRELFETLSAIRVTPDQLINAVESLHKAGTLHAQLRYE